MPVSYTLDADAMRRTADAVKFVEAMPRDNRGPQRRRRSVSRGGGSGSTAGIAVLTQALSYGGTATAHLLDGKTRDVKETITVYPWKMQPGDSLPDGTEIDVNQVDGQWYLRNAACPAGANS